jgi:membrane protease YdiL (CAAX protease family)
VTNEAQAAPSNARLAEPLAAFFAATAIASALYWTGRAVPFVRDNLHGFIAIVFLYAPSVAARLARNPFDYERAGLTVHPVRANATTLAFALLVTWPVFFAAFLAFYRTGCQPGSPRVVALWSELFAPVCGRWRGLAGASLRWPPNFPTVALSQLVVVAIPEELFFRGYLLDRFERRWPSRRRLFGAPVGRPIVAQAALFAIGHVLVDFDPARLAVFVPGLVFGWMRARSGSLAAGAVFHALCNLLSDVLYLSFF